MKNIHRQFKTINRQIIEFTDNSMKFTKVKEQIWTIKENQRTSNTINDNLLKSTENACNFMKNQ